MKTKSKESSKFSKNRCKKTTLNPTFDLFGDVIVTLFDIYMWVAVITKGRFLGNLNRYNHYVEFWDVAYKVKMSKINGFFEQVRREYYLYWHNRDWKPDFIKG